MPGDFIGSNNGKLALIMQNDGNLVLYTFKNALNCQKMTDGYMGGGYLANALYDIGNVGIPDNIGKLAYIDQNSNLFNYESVEKTNNYIQVSNTNSLTNDIPNTSYTNTTVTSCKETCNKLDDCAGFVFMKSNNTCYPKSKINSNTKTNDTSTDLYIREIAPLNTPVGVTKQTNYINSVTYQNYLNGGTFEKNYGIANITTAQQTQLDQLQNKLNLLSNQITQNTDLLGENTQRAETQMNNNVKGLGNYITDLTNTDKQIKYLNTNTNMDNILNDSDIITLQKNYEYVFWSILAIGTLLISMNVMKK
jgi:hypothetical protein